MLMHAMVPVSLPIHRPLLALCVAVMVTSCSDPSQDAPSSQTPQSIRIASLFNQDHYIGEKLDWIANELNRRGQGRLQCQVFHGGSAGGEKENLEDLLLGNLEIMAGAGSYYYKYCPEATILELPLYDWQDSTEAHHVIRAFWEPLVEVSRAKGFQPLALDIRDYWGVLCRDPVTAIADLQGTKFRSVNADLWIELTKLYGAVPNPMPYADAYMAFKTGVSDGVLASLTNAHSAKWHEVLKCFLDTRLVLSESLTLTSKGWWDGLPEDLRQLITEVCEESEQVNLEAVSAHYQRGRQAMAEAGVTLVEHDQLDLSEIQTKARHFRDQYMRAKGDEVYAFYQKWLEHMSATKTAWRESASSELNPWPRPNARPPTTNRLESDSFPGSNETRGIDRATRSPIRGPRYRAAPHPTSPPGKTKSAQRFPEAAFAQSHN